MSVITMPRLNNICIPKTVDELFECFKWKYDLIMHDKDRFSFPLYYIKGITIPDPNKRFYKVYYYSDKSETMTAFTLKMTDDIVLPKICPKCDQKLAQIFMDTLTYSFTNCTPICCSPEFGIDLLQSDIMIVVVYKNANNKLAYIFEYKDDLFDEPLIC